MATRRGYRHVCPLIDVIAAYTMLSDQLPYASQTTMATEAGVTDRTVRNWLTVLELLGIVEVYRSRPKRQPDGTYTRTTNRYLLCDRRVGRASTSCPLPRRHHKPASTRGSSPRGNQFPLTLLGTESQGVDPHVDDPPKTVRCMVDEDLESEKCSDPPRLAPDQALQRLNEMRRHLRP